MKNKHIIWSDMNLKLDDWKDYFEENNISDKDKYDEMCSVNDEYLYDAMLNLKSISGRVLVIADLGLWNGRHFAYKIVPCFTDALFDSCDNKEWYVEGNDVKFTGAHHDGTNHYTYYMIKNEDSIEALKRALYRLMYEGAGKIENILKRFVSKTELSKQIKSVYGWA